MMEWMKEWRSDGIKEWIKEWNEINEWWVNEGLNGINEGRNEWIK